MPIFPKSVRRPWQPEHKPQEGRRQSNAKFYQSTAWRKLRALKIEVQPLCEECLRRGIATPARVVDHIVPINKGGAALSLANLQSLCDACHNRNSATDK